MYETTHDGDGVIYATHTDGAQLRRDAKAYVARHDTLLRAHELTEIKRPD